MGSCLLSDWRRSGSTCCGISTHGCPGHQLANSAQDAKQIESQAEHADSPSISTGYRLAIRGAILTDLRRMLDEVHDVVEMTSHPSLREQAKGLSER